jgi:hypothetical protein
MRVMGYSKSPDLASGLARSRADQVQSPCSSYARMSTVRARGRLPSRSIERVVPGGVLSPASQAGEFAWRRRFVGSRKCGSASMLPKLPASLMHTQKGAESGAGEFERSFDAQSAKLPLAAPGERA